MLLAWILAGSSGCAARIPLVWKDYSSYFTRGDGLGGCPELAGTYAVEGQGTDYLITFPLPLLVPVWWGRNPETPRLDVDMGLVPDGSVSAMVEAAAYVVFEQPDAIRLVVSLLDESGRAIDGFERIEFLRFGGDVDGPPDQPRSFHCLASRPLSIEIDIGLVISSGYRHPESGTYAMSVMLGRLPDGSLAVRTHAYMPSLFFIADQRWHRYESTSPPEPSQ